MACILQRKGSDKSLAWRSALVHMDLREAEESMRASEGDDATLLRSARRVLSCRGCVEEAVGQPFRNVRCCDVRAALGGA